MNSCKAKVCGFKKYGKEADDICRAIIAERWNGNFFETGARNFKQFWIRDFGWCSNALARLGFKDEVRASLFYALNIFLKNRKVTTTISPCGRAYDVFYFAPDSLAFLLKAILDCSSKQLIEPYKDFLNSQIESFFNKVIDKDTGLVRPDVKVSSIKDYAKRRSSCYDNCIVGMLAQSIKKLKAGLENPFAQYNYKKSIKSNFWTGSFFLEEVDGKEIVTGDSNIFPFWCGLFQNKGMFLKVLDAIKGAGLDSPFPLRYSTRPSRMLIYSVFVPNYEGTTIWAHLGMLFIDVVSRFCKTLAREYLDSYKAQIERFGNFLEVFDEHGMPYKSLFYLCEEGMLWAALYLMLKRCLA